MTRRPAFPARGGAMLRSAPLREGGARWANIACTTKGRSWPAETVGVNLSRHDAHEPPRYRASPGSMLRDHPLLAYALSALLALGAVVALLGAYGLVAALLGALAWFALPEREPTLRAARAPVARLPRR